MTQDGTFVLNSSPDMSEYSYLPTTLVGLTLTDTFSKSYWEGSTEMSDYVESFYFISDTEVVGVGKESASSMSIDNTYAFFRNLRVDGFREYWLSFVRFNN